MYKLNSEQQAALQMSIDGHNFVLTGSAGTGKSYTVSTIVKHLRSLGKEVALTCSTGISCLVYPNLQATTIHTFCGIGDGRYSIEEAHNIVKNSSKHQNVVHAVRKTDVVIIDECSMISSRTLSLITEVFAIKDPSLQLGGIHVILSGDFRQLPPVKDQQYGDNGAYCFENELFPLLFPHRVTLSKVHRQADKRLISAIDEVCEGHISKETVEYIHALDKPSSNVKCKLFSTNDLVDDYNRKQILEHSGDLVEYVSTDSGNVADLRRLTVPKTLWLKVGIPVILLRNLTTHLVNGLQGIVTGIGPDGPVVQDVTMRMTKFNFQVFSPKLNKNTATREQYPIKPAFGITIHKAQGMTLDSIEVDCQQIFQAGQLGVAISRATSAEGLSVKNFNMKACISHPRIVNGFLQQQPHLPKADRSCCRNEIRYCTFTGMFL